MSAHVYRAWSDEQLIEAGASPGAAMEMTRRLKASIQEQEKASTALGNKLWWLNLWLLVFTAAIFALTGVLVWLAIHGRA